MKYKIKYPKYLQIYNQSTFPFIKKQGIYIYFGMGQADLNN